MKERIAFSWSGGKDSALALYYLLQTGRYEVAYLLSNFNADKELSMHAVSIDLIEKQAEAIGIPLIQVHVQSNENASYEKAMVSVLTRLKSEGIFKVGYGDIFLENLKTYREQKLQSIGMEALFPLWKLNSLFLMNKFIDLGFKSLVCCVNDKILGEAFIDKTITKDWLANLPLEIDPCGENGEFHTFCYGGPIFKQSVTFGISYNWVKEYQFKLSDGVEMNERYRYSNLIALN